MLISEYVKPVLVLICRLLGTHPLLMKAFGIFPNVMFKAIKLVSCDIQRNCISSFENLHLFHVFMTEYSVVIFAKNDLLSHWYPGSGVVLYCIDS